MNIPEKTIMIGDFGKDLDDENALLYAIGAHKKSELNLVGVVANLSPALLRARIAKGMLDHLGIDIPVAVGTSCNVADNTQEYEADIPYLSNKTKFSDGRALMTDILTESEGGSVQLVLNSGLTDTAEIIKTDPDLCKHTLSRVAIMGGILCTEDDVILNNHGYMTPDDAANNRFDPEAAAFVYNWLQANNIPMSIITREAAYACKFGIEFYERLVQIDDVVGRGIRDRQLPAVEHLWKAANAPAGSEVRGTLPDRCTREWFVRSYLDGVDPGNVKKVWDPALQIGTFQYDSLNVASIVHPELFAPKIVQIDGKDHQVIGISPASPGIRDANILRNNIEANITEALV